MIILKCCSSAFLTSGFGIYLLLFADKGAVAIEEISTLAAAQKRACVFPPLGNTFAMESLEQSLLDKLLELEAASKTLATANPKPNLMRLFEEVENLAGRLPKSSNPSLLHYLQRKSYQKARLLLQGKNPESETPEAGKCVR